MHKARTQFIMLRCTQSEKDTAKELAKSLNRSLSELLRESITRTQTHRSKDIEHMKMIKREVIKVCNSLNQISRMQAVKQNIDILLELSIIKEHIKELNVY